MQARREQTYLMSIVEHANSYDFAYKLVAVSSFVLEFTKCSLYIKNAVEWLMIFSFTVMRSFRAIGDDLFG